MLAALGVKNKYIIVPSYTFVGTVAAIVWSGNKPIFCDGDVSLFNLESTITSGITAIWTGTGVSGNNFDPSVLAGGTSVVITREVNDGGLFVLKVMSYNMRILIII